MDDDMELMLMDAHARGLLHGRKPAADPGTDDHEEVKLVG
jgi:hypothetical protein